MASTDPEPASQGDWPLLPHGQFDDFLPPDEHQALLDWAIAGEDRFQPAKVTRGTLGDHDQVEAEFRIALKRPDLGPHEERFRRRLMEFLPKAMAAIGASGPPPTSIELEVTAYGDGAHFARHQDIPIGANRSTLGSAAGEDRLISAVYYFHRLPRQFTGGALHLYPIGAASGGIDIDPRDNRLVVFPSWAPHSVEPVSCPEGRFAQFRFAVNCWFCRALDGSKASR